MRRGPRVIAAASIGVLVVGAVTWGGYRRFYGAPRAGLEQSIADVSARLRGRRDALDDAVRVQRELQALADRTLGGDVESVDHRLRSRLNRIAESLELPTFVVSTAAASARRSPARAAFPRRGIWRTMRDETDFVELSATITAEGGLEPVIGLVDRIDAEPWIKRIEQLSIAPKGGAGTRVRGSVFRVSLRLVTILFPAREPTAGLDPPPYERDRLARFESLVGANPFRLPPPAPEAVVVETAPARPPAFPWNAWLLTGVAEGPSGPEAWLRNTASGASRRLAVGDALADAKLVGVDGEWASFRLGTGTFRVQVGGTLANRTAQVRPRPQR